MSILDLFLADTHFKQCNLSVSMFYNCIRNNNRADQSITIFMYLVEDKTSPRYK